MVLFFPIQQELDCINGGGHILGKIKFDVPNNQHIFCPADESVVLSSLEQTAIAEKISSLDAGAYAITMQDDD